jgi:hypothetical protein
MLATLARRARAALPNARRKPPSSSDADAARGDGQALPRASDFPSTLSMADPLVARVVAWHNAHPLAWKIDARHVVSVGHVWLPFEVPATPPKKPGSRRGWKAAFSDNFIAPLRPRQVARWALEHGWQPFGEQSNAAATAGAVRSVGPDAKLRDRPLETLWLATAAIELGATRRRVLVGHAADPHRAPVLGPRVWRRRLVAGVLAASSAAAGAAVAVAAMLWMSLLRPAPAEPAASTLAAVAATPAVGVAVSAAASAAAPVGPKADVAASAGALSASEPTMADAATAPAESASASASAETERPRVALAPPETSPPPPAPSRGEKPRLFQPLDDAAKATARDELAAARAARDEDRRARGLPPLPAPGSAQAQAAAKAASAAAAAGAPAQPPSLIAQAAQAPQTWALTSRVLRTRAESERLLLALRAAGAATKPAAQSQQLVFEVLSVGPDWRAVGYPFATRADAERARALLAQRGINVEVAAF